MRKLSALDLAFFIAESEGSPKHVAGLMLFEKPPGSSPNFVKNLVSELKTYQQLTEPFNLVIRFAGLTGPHWVPCRDFDIDQHVFYHRPKKSSNWQEVKELVSQLHEPLMDRSRPLWEYHVIDGINKRRFAVYVKIHHAYADGMTMTTWLDRSLSTSAEDQQMVPVWTMPARKKKKVQESAFSLRDNIRKLTGLSRNQVITAGGIAKMSAQQLMERTGLTRKSVSLEWNTAHETPLTGSATSGRGIATTFVPMEQVRRICKATSCTLNHVALACIDSALHRYLAETGHPVDHPITVQMPVNLRSGTGGKAGNKLGVALVELATPTDDPLVRLQEIGFSLRNVKNRVDNIPGDSMQQYTVLMALAGELIEKLKLSDRVPTNGHMLVSNVPGPRDQLYLKGAKVLQMCPISTLVPGLRMNTTLFSCGGILNFGIVATRDLRNLDSLARYIKEEFDILEEAVNS